MFILSANPNKPNRLTVENKDENVQYHLDYARWIVANSYNEKHNLWLRRIEINRNFYMNNQWIMDEDTIAFLMDTTGQTRNRIKIRHNLIRPMVEQYRGNAVIMKINASLKNISPLSVNRRENLLSEKIFKTRVANEFPWIGQQMRKKDGSIGEDETETTQIFENLYVDDYVKQMNKLLRYVSYLNEFADKQTKVAENLATTGLIASEAFNHGGDRRYELLESDDCYWDRNARKNDLTDASFCGYMKDLDPSYINERWQLDPDQANAIERYTEVWSSGNMMMNSISNRSVNAYRIPTYNSFWKDTERCEMGYIKDEFDYPMLVKVNYVYPGDTEPRYTDSDLIDPPDTNQNKKAFKGKKKISRYLDYVRFCRFIPGECVGPAYQDYNPSKKSMEYDIPLEYGRLEYQSIDQMDYNNVKFPIKFQTWGYLNGDVFSPIDDAIDPQRFINRVLSVTEQLINNSGGSGMVVDEDSLSDGPASLAKVYTDSKEGKPISVRTRGKGITNTVGYYDNTPKAGTYGMFNVIPIIKQMMTDTSGINEGLKGESTGSDQLVGVTELLIQRGSLMQEPFYYAMRNFFLQLYQDAATVGKRFYLDNERELSIITGDEGVETLKLSKDLENEDFRAFVTQENSDETLKSQANQMLMALYQYQLIDEKGFADLYNRATPDDVTMKLRSQVGIRAEAARRQAKEQAEAQRFALSQQQQYAERERNDQINEQNQNAAIQFGKQNVDLAKAVMSASPQEKAAT